MVNINASHVNLAAVCITGYHACTKTNDDRVLPTRQYANNSNLLPNPKALIMRF
jgi:hypothetical protein